MVKDLLSLSGNRITFLLNRAINRNNDRYGGEASQTYGYSVGGSESFINNRNYKYKGNSWIGINPSGSIFYFNVWINRDAGSPIEIVK